MNWLYQHGILVDDVASVKPMAVLYVDDRGFRFEGDWQAVVDFTSASANLTPWNK